MQDPNPTLVSSQLYISEAAESNEKTQNDLKVPDPSDEEMERVLANAVNGK